MFPSSRVYNVQDTTVLFFSRLSFFFKLVFLLYEIGASDGVQDLRRNQQRVSLAVELWVMDGFYGMAKEKWLIFYTMIA